MKRFVKMHKTRGTRKTTVDKCICLNVNKMKRDGLFRMKRSRGNLQWFHSETGCVIYEVGYEVMPGMSGRKRLTLTHPLRRIILRIFVNCKSISTFLSRTIGV